jgi:D-sedoheptulose 7-phosphate isomerase
VSHIRKHFEEAQAVLETFISDPENIRKIEQAGDLIAAAFRTGKKVYSCGNGGSMCDAMHFAEELSGRYRNDRPAFPSMAISDPAHITCTGNDYGFEFIFSRYLEAFGNEGDVLLAISTSGNSPNILRAMEAAKAKNMKIIALTGKDGGKAAALAGIEIRAPHSSYADRAQEIHIKIIHSLIDHVERTLL